MSSFAAAVVSRLASLSPIHKDMTDTESIISSQGACSSSLASSSTSDASFDARYTHSDHALAASPVATRYDTTPNKGGLRRNEHLAVLLHRSLWKPDSQASRCDIFLCSRKFSIFERRHHCRKCGGVFCADCSTHATTLLDTSHLPFLNPPKGTPIAAYASPESPVLAARVCDECWDQIHGTKSPRSRILQQKKLEEAERWEDSSSSTGSSTSSPRTPHTPLDALPPSLSRMPLRRAHTSPRVHTLSSTASQSSSSASSSDSNPAAATTTTSSELDAYPLRHASAICKANGGGRWQPKPCVEVIGVKVPGAKAAYELEMEREEEERRMSRLNPVVKDGDFQLWFPRDVEPRSVAGPYTLSTF
ncbi:FYVE zinc finger-domain-containing protein [Irpex lacteus]|nr:FYVE zinc finger-domain-containing protein [Irpex lacteus]